VTSEDVARQRAHNALAVFNAIPRLSDCGSPDGQPDAVHRLTRTLESALKAHQLPAHTRARTDESTVIRFPVERTRS
jgi:hypothetical protein